MHAPARSAAWWIICFIQQVTIDPLSAEADALRSWYDAEGRPAAATFTPLGGGAAAGGGAGGAGGAGGRANRLQVLGDVLVSMQQ